VGTDRLALAIRTARGDVLIGRDNGLLVGPAEALGGIAEVRSIESRELMLPVRLLDAGCWCIWAPPP